MNPKKKEKTPCTYLSIIMLDSVIKAKKKYYPQTFLEECQYEQKSNSLLPSVESKIKYLFPFFSSIYPLS